MGDLSSTAGRSRSAVVPRFVLDAYGSEIESAAEGRAAIVADDDPVGLEGSLGNVELLVTGIDEAVFNRVIEAPGLRWVHSISAGVEHLPLTQMAQRGVLLTNSAGAHAPAMAEYALAGMIMLARDMLSWLDGQRERRWIVADSFRAGVLRGKRLGIVGFGAVGRQLAAAAKTLGMEVWATRRTPLFASGDPLDRLLTAEQLPDLLAASDFIVLSASLNRSTQHILGEAEFAVMKPTAVLVNVARGGLVDEAALIRALREGRLRAALLDVTAEEPLPSESELWNVPNLFITPPHLRQRARELALGCRVLLPKPPTVPGWFARTDGEPHRLLRRDLSVRSANPRQSLPVFGNVGALSYSLGSATLFGSGGRIGSRDTRR